MEGVTDRSITATCDMISPTLADGDDVAFIPYVTSDRDKEASTPLTEMTYLHTSDGDMEPHTFDGDNGASIPGPHIIQL
jgi:hypothetical protein